MVGWNSLRGSRKLDSLRGFRFTDFRFASIRIARIFIPVCVRYNHAHFIEE